MTLRDITLLQSHLHTANSASQCSAVTVVGKSHLFLNLQKPPLYDHFAAKEP